MNTETTVENWEMRDEECTLLHFWNGNVKLCSTIKHYIHQAAPPTGKYDHKNAQHCTACLRFMQNKLMITE